MISQEDLQALLLDLESDRVERTAATSNTDKFSEAVTAFANDLPSHRKPGYLIVGVKDDGSPTGIEVSDRLLQNLAALRSDGNIQPLPAITVGKFSLDDGDVAVEVQPSDLPPVRYKGRVWVGVGPRRAVATEQEERVLSEKRISHAVTFDAQPCLDSTLEDISTELFKRDYLPHAVAAEVIAENHRSLEEQLSSLRFYDLKRGCPTNAGILLLGKNPLDWLPGAYVQFLRVDGPTLADYEAVMEKKISGDLLTMLRELDSLIHVHTSSRPVPVSALREKQMADYPPSAIRELLMNAVMHRSYQATGPVRVSWLSDRVEIQSPGGLFGEASPENFPKRNSYRNPIIAEAMKTLGYVNRFGNGVLRAQAALERNGSPKAEFEFYAHYVIATVRMAQ